MPDFHGPIQHVTIVGTLWLVLALPFAAALFCAVRALSPRTLDARARHAIATLSLGATGLALATTGFHVWLLATKGAGERFLLQHVWRMVRVGQLDASFDLALDPLSATLAILVTAAGLAVFVRAAADKRDKRGKRDEQDPGAFARLFAWLNGFVAAMLLVVLADNFVLLLFGWEALGLCTWGLLGLRGEDARGRAFVRGLVGDAALVLGMALLYWGLGGAWDNGDYVPDLSARFASVEVVAGEPSAPEPSGDDEADDESAPKLPPMTGEGYLTLTSYSGAVVFMDDTRAPLQRAPGELLRAPFARFPVKGGLHSFRIHPGGGLDDFLVTHVAFGGEREIALAPFGPTVTFRAMRDELAAHDAHGRAPVREALVGRRVLGRYTVLTVACLLLFLGAIGKAAQLPLRAWLRSPAAGGAPAESPAPAQIHAAALVAAGGYLVARLGFVVALAPLASALLAAVGAGVSLVVATRLLALAEPAGAFLVELDLRVIDGLVNGTGVMTRALAWVVGRADDGIVDGAVRLLSTGAVRVGGRMQRVQSGRIQTYVLVTIAGIIALAFLPYWLR